MKSAYVTITMHQDYWHDVLVDLDDYRERLYDQDEGLILEPGTVLLKEELRAEGVEN